MFVSSIYAQELKFLGGLNLSRYSIYPEVYQDIYGFQYNDKSNFKMGSVIGCGIEFPFTKKITFGIEALYIQKGSKIKTESPSIEIYSAPKEYTLSTISFPILLRTRFLKGSSPYILGGGEFSFIISHRYINILNGQGRDSLDIKENTHNFDYGLVFGFGFEIKIEEHSFFIEGRYHLGIKNISKVYQRYESIKTNAIVVVMGFKI